ncbi:hypothetical protein EGM88_10525 [Aureibaculum marinum]|uniref:Gliding motility-associated C-terminal domain-containing protein n=1 Tax=Aureibaculum marinum TaxID=2487930 RepID=A0A3N4NIM3_9FLAO|nr:hypothetical protein [Aureibaculum marinum]RPD96194.1 hypothetical protein EGM88_10525 [Aureibaculum marinum]
MKNNYLTKGFVLVFLLSQLVAYSGEQPKPTLKKIPIESNSFTSNTDPGWSYTCDDGIEVELLSLGLKNNVPTTLTIGDTKNVQRVVVEIVYKGNNPGSTIEVSDDSGNTYTATRVVPTGGSSNVWYYRTELPATSTVSYNNSSKSSYAQSILAYVFRKKNNGTASSGVFTALSGYNNIETTTIPIQTDSGPRTVTVELPISELTPDGRYIHIEVSAADGSFAELTETIDSFPTGQCCIKVFELTMKDVAGSVDEIEIKIDTRAKKNGQSVFGQSWVMGGAIKTNVRCSCVESDTELPTADNFVDYILLEDISQMPNVTFSDNCSEVTIEYREYLSRESCDIDFNTNATDSNVIFNGITSNNEYSWKKGHYVQVDDGTAKIFGQLTNNADPNSGYSTNLYFEKVMGYALWIKAGNEVGTAADADRHKYANVDFTKENSFKGFGVDKENNIALANTNSHYLDIGPRDQFGYPNVAFKLAYTGTVGGQAIPSGQHIEMDAAFTRCVRARDGAELWVREWTVTDAAGNTAVFVQRAEVEIY